LKASLKFRFLVVLTVMTISGLAAAQDQYVDPPSRVARLQIVEGRVSLQPGGVDDWVDAGMNRPLTTADRIWTDRDSRTEMTIGSAALRLGSETSMTLTNLSDDTAQIELDQGTLSLSVRYLNGGDIVEVDTPNIAFTVLQPGEYRFDVRPDADQTAVLVRRGEGEASGQNGSLNVPTGQSFVFGNGQSLEYTVANARPRDSFEGWGVERERREISSPSAQYVAAGTIGYEALDDNGNWEPSPVYGAVWYPNVHPGWAPYHEGHWAWVEPWGWTWVDDAPWGFAPFHYGRWVNDRERWGWVPGPHEARPMYAPALVAWVGGGPGFGASIGIGGGGVGWIALGWHDPFIPSYHVSPEYARNVNVSNSRVVNVTVVNNYYNTTNVNVRNTTISNIHYENTKVSGAMTAVPSAAFSSGKPVAQAAVVIPPGAAAQVRFGAAANVPPTKAAVLGGHAPAKAPAGLAAPRQVIAKTPPPPPPVSFAQQRPLLEKSNGVPLSPATRANLTATNPAPAAHGGRPAVVTAAGAPSRPGVAPAPAANKAGAPASRPATAPPPSSPVPAAHPATPPAPAPVPGRPVTPPPTAPGRPVTPPPTAPGREAAPPSRPVTPPAPVRPATPPAAPPSREVAPAPRPATPPPGREAAPAPKKNPPPAKDNKDNKEKDKEPKTN
jgi:FecR protein